VRYEDLHASPLPTLRRVLAFMHVDGVSDVVLKVEGGESERLGVTHVKMLECD
jgi:hypothetical protein